jgi:hypothetical protein
VKLGRELSLGVVGNESFDRDLEFIYYQSRDFVKQVYSWPVVDIPLRPLSTPSGRPQLSRCGPNFFACPVLR